MMCLQRWFSHRSGDGASGVAAVAKGGYGFLQLLTNHHISLLLLVPKNSAASDFEECGSVAVILAWPWSDDSDRYREVELDR